MDPRQRWALELAWELFEDAFVVPETVSGQPVSVYIGATMDDYAVLTLRDTEDNLDHHSFTGISRGMIANRVSYAFGLHGPSMIDYIEAHGTGTKIGDSVEARALGEIFAERGDRPVNVGSVKTNIGHAAGAAGIAGLLKTVLAIENAEIPPSLNYGSVNPEIDLKSSGLQVNTTLEPWPMAEGRPRRAGVSSFGMGGTNAHVIVEQAPALHDGVVEGLVEQCPPLHNGVLEGSVAGQPWPMATLIVPTT